jgi:hypothetical protein
MSPGDYLHTKTNLRPSHEPQFLHAAQKNLLHIVEHFLHFGQIIPIIYRLVRFIPFATSFQDRDMQILWQILDQLRALTDRKDLFFIGRISPYLG